MRKLGICICLCVFLAQSNILQAQSSNETVSGRKASRNVRKRMSFAEEIIYRRAHYRAQQRANRTEARKWRGYSPLRPNIRIGHHAVDWNQSLWMPYASYYHPPNWLHASYR